MSNPWLLPTLLATLPSSIFLFAIYSYLYYREKQKSLLMWAICCFFHILFYIGNIFLATGMTGIYRFYPNVTFDFLIATFQLIGCMYFLKRSTPRAAKIILVIVGAWAVYLDLVNTIDFLLMSPVYLLIGFSQIFTGVSFLRLTENNIGKKIVGWILILWGFHVLNYPILRPIPELAYIGFSIGGFFRTSLAIAILLFYFEETKNTLQQTQNDYKKIIETTQEGIWMIDKDANTSFVNDKMCDFLEISEKDFIGKSLFDFVDPEYRTIVEKRLGERKLGLSEIHDFHFKNKKGESIWLLMSSSPIFDIHGNYDGSIAMSTDITPFKKAEGALKERERQLSTLIKNLPGIAYRCKVNIDWTMEFISDGCFELTGYSPSDFVDNRTVSFGSIIHEDDSERVYNEVITAINANQSYRLVYRILHRNGSLRWAWEQGSAVKGESGEILALEGFIADFSQVKAAEEMMSKTLEEKEILLKEVHHRVKNYLQVLSSLLSMHMDSSEESESKSVLFESQNRIQSMAYVHESLYGKNSVSDEFFPEYVSKLVESLLRSFGYKADEIRIDLKCEPVPLRQNAFIPIGLILNELVTNALKHAFISKPSAEVKSLGIAFYTEGNWVHLEVSDNGSGKDRKDRPSESMGLELVDLLAKQLKGNVLDLAHSQGTTTRVRFPILF
ncbi:PAS domain S-box protein [Leptospira inadai serovar Lyme str. 10]|uniref:histidine kinase n=2 Tax=Leptospira inadai serovar Lyme TaxID=293084 RepID=V6HZP3_9LEPT|nr:PAS domain S-box protein [Leptospira inadai]EQA38484.1 PAS domain S-box protein [Leptospira inadai serovar Lyme str. 10]PNV75223.1 histidine kinase [Leptospira inadai serovar Lyme]